MSDLPAFWVKTSLGNLLQFNYGKSLPGNGRSGEGFPVYGSNGIVGYHNIALTAGETLIIGRKGSVGEVHFSARTCFPIDTTYYVDRFYGMPAQYWFYQLKNLDLSDLNKATAIPGINREDAYNAEVYLAPLNEQKRIADKLDRLLTQVDACRDRLDRVLLILKRFRQSVLAAATSGEITEDWRTEHKSSEHELEAEFDFTDAACFGDFRFPSSWSVNRLGEIAEIIGGITKDTKKQDPSDEELPYLRVANVQRGFFNLNEIKTIRVPHQRIEKLLLKKGDILLNEGGDIDKLGRGWVWNGEIERCTFQNHVFRVRLHNEFFEPKFFFLVGEFTRCSLFSFSW